MGPGGLPEVYQDLATLSPGEQDLEDAFLDAQALLDQSRHLVAVQELGGHVDQQRSSPQAECGAQQAEFGPSGSGRLGHQAAKMQQVQGVAVGLEAVSPGDRGHRALLDAVFREQAAQPQDTALQGGLRRRRLLLPPHGLPEAFRRDHLTGTEQERRQ